MSKKPPRRTAERILEVALDLCNRFGMTNVSTTQISSEMGISPGNLYYHYASKDDLINTLFDQHEFSMLAVLNTSDLVRDVPGAWQFTQALFGSIWQYRFVYRDLNHLLANNHRVETHMQELLAHKKAALLEVLVTLQRAGTLQLQPRDADSLAASMVLVLMYWLSYEYVRDPRQALEPDSGPAAMQRGTVQVMALMAPYLPAASRQQLDELVVSQMNCPASLPSVQDADEGRQAWR